MALNILTAWTSNQPIILDWRRTLPWHKTNKWTNRTIQSITGIVIHQTLGGDKPLNTNDYHVNNNQWPHIAYHFYIDKKGVIYWCNSLEDWTWHTGPKANRNHIGIVCGGNFSGTGYQGKELPTQLQLDALKNLVNWLKPNLYLNNKQIKFHSNYGKPACPGYNIENYINQEFPKK